MLIDDLLSSRYQLDSFTKKRLQVSTVFYVQDVVDYLDHFGREGEWSDVAPNIAPLAPFMWFEWREETSRIGVLVTCLSSERDDVAWMYDFVEFFCDEDGNVDTLDRSIAPVMDVAADGRFIRVRVPNNYDERVNKLIRNLFEVVLVSICFAHCKGVSITDHEQSRQQRRAAERAGKPPLVRFKTINIAPVTRILREEGDIEHNGIKKALHICRGHFAHYTEDAPLFGKYTGTFFRPMHVRGTMERGVVVKDYNITDKAAPLT